TLNDGRTLQRGILSSAGSRSLIRERLCFFARRPFGDRRPGGLHSTTEPRSGSDRVGSVPLNTEQDAVATASGPVIVKKRKSTMPPRLRGFSRPGRYRSSVL